MGKEYKLEPYFEKNQRLPIWDFNEEYFFLHKDTNLRWHTPGVIDGGIFFHGDFNPITSTLSMFTREDGFVEGRYLDRWVLHFERYRCTNFLIRVNDRTGEIVCSDLVNPNRKRYIVQYFDYLANEERATRIDAASEEEAMVVAWAASCYKNKNIDPSMYRVCTEYKPMTRGSVGVSDDVFKTQIAIIKANKEDE